MYKFRYLFILMFLSTSLFARYVNDKASLGNISLSAGVWKSNLAGDIYNNRPSNTSLENDLGYSSKNITTFGMDLKNDYSWLPNININYFKLSNTANANLNSIKYIDTTSFNNSVSSSSKYSQIDATFYGYLYNGPFELDLGIKVKKIDFLLDLQENISSGGHSITIEGPDSVVVLPHVALKINLAFINTVLKVQTSMLSIDDVNAKDYEYSINYRVMRNMYISYGYKYTSWKSQNINNKHEKYDIEIKGKYISAKILF